MTDARPLIVHVIYALGAGGLENGMINIINRMPVDSYRHAIVCLKQSGEFEARITAPDVAVYSLHCKEGQDFGLYWRFWRLLRDLRPALVHTRNLAALEMQALVFLMPGVKGVHGEHGRDIYDVDGGNSRYRWLRRLLSPCIDRFITVSMDLHGWLINDVGISAVKVTQIYNGVDCDKFAPLSFAPVNKLTASDAEDCAAATLTLTNIGTVGRLAEIKDQASLIKALRLLLDAQPALHGRVRLSLVGDGPLADTLGQLVSELELDSLVTFYGNRDDIPQLLQDMDIFVLPSLGEGISNTILEAMASGLPIVATHVGGNPELVTPGINGLLVPPSSPRELADALLTLLADPQKISDMGQASLKAVRSRFDWQKTVQEYAAVYNELLSRPVEPARVGI